MDNSNWKKLVRIGICCLYLKLTNVIIQLNTSGSSISSAVLEAPACRNGSECRGT